MAGAPNIGVDAIMHATEDHSIVIGSLRDALGLDPDALDITTTDGHYHNPISKVSGRLRGRDARMFLDRFCGLLPPEQAGELSRTLPSRIDGSTLYIRVGKQELIAGRVIIKDADAVRIRITVPVYNGGAEDAFRNLLGLD